MLTRVYQSSMGHLQDASLADWDTHASKVQQRQLQANAPHGAQAPTRTCCSSTDQAPALASRLGFIYPKSPPTNRATLVPAPPTQMTANGKYHCTINLFSVPYGAKYGCQPADSDSASLEHYQGLTTRQETCIK